MILKFGTEARRRKKRSLSSHNTEAVSSAGAGSTEQTYAKRKVTCLGPDCKGAQ